MDLTTSFTLIVVAAIGAVPSLLNGRKLDKVHADVNGKVTELLQASKSRDVAEGKAAGVRQERSEERARHAEIIIPGTHD